MVFLYTVITKNIIYIHNALIKVHKENKLSSSSAKQLILYEINVVLSDNMKIMKNQKRGCKTEKKRTLQTVEQEQEQ